jgi:hypothetical protein
MFYYLQEAQNRPAGASVPALGLSNKAICSPLYRKPRTDQKEHSFIVQNKSRDTNSCWSVLGVLLSKEHIAVLYSPKEGR